MKDQEESLGLGIYGEGWAKAFLLRIQVSGALKEMVDKLASIENENFSEQKNAIFKVKKKNQKTKKDFAWWDSQRANFLNTQRTSSYKLIRREQNDPKENKKGDWRYQTGSSIANKCMKHY